MSTGTMRLIDASISLALIRPSSTSSKSTTPRGTISSAGRASEDGRGEWPPDAWACRSTVRGCQVSLSAFPDAGEFGYTWVPSARGDKATSSSPWGLGIPVNAPRPDLSFELIEFFSTTEALQIVFDAVGWLNGNLAAIRELDVSSRARDCSDHRDVYGSRSPHRPAAAADT